MKRDITARWPYRQWLKRNVFTFDELPRVPAPPRLEEHELRVTQRAFGWTDEDLKQLVLPMAETGHEPTGSMGKDSPLAVLSDQAPSLFRYFHQLFAQVTNPAIDPHREALVMSLATATGPDGNTLEETPDQCHRLTLPGPILTNGQLARLGRESRTRACSSPAGCRPCSTSTAARARSRPRWSGSASRRWRRWTRAVACSSSATAAWTRRRAPIPALLALSAVHQRLTRDGIRMQTGLAGGDGRGTRGARLRRALRLRRRGGESLPGAGHRPGAGGLGRDAARRERGAEPVHQGHRGGAAQGDVQDGHLHPPVLPRRADLRGGGARPRARGPALHRHALAARRRGLRRAAARGPRAPRARLRSRGTGCRPLPIGRAVPVAPPGRAAPVEPAAPWRCSRPRCRARTGRRSGSSAPRRTTRPAAGRPCGGSSSWCRPRSRSRSRRSSQLGVHRPALRHRGHELREHQRRGARDAGHRHEPARRPQQLRRGRRGVAALRPRRRTATCAAARSSRWRARASASAPSTWSTPTSCRSRSPREPSPARAGSSPGTRWTSASPGSAAPRRG